MVSPFAEQLSYAFWLSDAAAQILPVFSRCYDACSSKQLDVAEYN